MVVRYFGCFPHLRHSGETGLFAGLGFSMPHEMPEKSYGQLENVRSKPARNLNHRATFWIGELSRAVRRSTMNEVDELVTAMLAIAFAP